MAISNENIRFTVVFDDYPKLTITDNIQSLYNSVYGYTLADVNIRIKIECSNGGVVYDGTSGAGDITLANSWTKSITQADGLPINVLGNMVNGLYTITYGVYIDDASTPVAVYAEQHNFEYTRPTPSLTLDYDCGIRINQNPYVRSKDTTNHYITYGGSQLSGTTTYTEHKLNFPVGTDETNINQSPATSQIITSSVWTSEYQALLRYNDLFTVQTQGTTIQTTIQYKTNATATGRNTVQCDDCTCLYWACLNNIYDKYYEYSGVNAVKSAKYKSILDAITMNYAFYLQALHCGEDASKYCNKLKEIATLENCDCSVASGVPIKISPKSTTSFNYIVSGSVNGSGDLILTDNNGGTINAGHVKGADGADGANGSNGSNGSNGANGANGDDGVSVVRVYYNSYNMNIQPDTWTTIRQEIFSSDLITSIGDGVEIKAKIRTWDVSIPDNIKYRIQINGHTICETMVMDGREVYISSENVCVYSSTSFIICPNSTYSTNNGIKQYISNPISTYNTDTITIQAYRDTTISNSNESIGVENLYIKKIKGSII